MAVSGFQAIILNFFPHNKNKNNNNSYQALTCAGAAGKNQFYTKIYHSLVFNGTPLNGTIKNRHWGHTVLFDVKLDGADFNLIVTFTITLI